MNDTAANGQLPTGSIIDSSAVYTFTSVECAAFNSKTTVIVDDTGTTFSTVDIAVSDDSQGTFVGNQPSC